ncbi:hemolysin family protein [unidentified bacterial endosymbiont]|uniref:hemolysin family protein n=1 Tax=unidentified bacterial endosymbiont TaxID=2355 RepID=UPI00209ED9B3|nr:hemolysin family protein [unidentified bacterial endosymbiont]
MISGILIICLLILFSAFFSFSELSLAASSSNKLKILSENGNAKATKALEFQKNPGLYFTVVQIGLNAVAILGGIVGDKFLSPSLTALFANYVGLIAAERISFVLSFALVTVAFILFADLLPKRFCMLKPETVLLNVVKLMSVIISLLRPFLILFDWAAKVILKMFGVSLENKNTITIEDIGEMIKSGASAGILCKEEQALIQNVFDFESKSITSVMTQRENIIWFDLHESYTDIKERIAKNPHSKFIVSNSTIDNLVGYVDSKIILSKYLDNAEISISKDIEINDVILVPDTLKMLELLGLFKKNRQDFAVIINEYGLVVGLVTLKDIMMAVMGDLVHEDKKKAMMLSDNNAWIVSGRTSIHEVIRTLDIRETPEIELYETMSGFMMYMLQKVPATNDKILFDGWEFIILSVENNIIDKLKATRIDGAKV